MIENEELRERVILVGVCSSESDDTEQSLDELKELAETAGAVTVGRIIQNREMIHPGTYVGKGKIVGMCVTDIHEFTYNTLLTTGMGKEKAKTVLHELESHPKIGNEPPESIDDKVFLLNSLAFILLILYFNPALIL